MFRMIDSAFIENQDVSAFDIVAVYGSRFGAQHGPYRETPSGFIQSLKKSVWVIYFPGVDIQSAIAEARSYPNVVGVAMDLESEWEYDIPSLDQCRSFGDAITPTFRTAIYSHRKTCESLASHYGAIWTAGEGQPSSVADNEAVQWMYHGDYDESAVGSYFLGITGVSPQSGDDDMDIQQVSAVIKLAYGQAELKRHAENPGSPLNTDAFKQDVVDPKGFGDNVNAVMDKSLDLHYVVNNILGPS